jgi:large subunit ribosomal protein L30
VNALTLYVAVRIRGTVDVSPEVSRTLYMLRLRRKFTATLYHSSQPGVLGMLKLAENWIAWGEIDRAILVELLRRRGRISGDKPLTDMWIRENLGLSGVEELADKLLAGELYLNKLRIQGVKPFFRLHPPKGGFKGSIRRRYGDGGVLGYWGSDIDKLLTLMI